MILITKSEKAVIAERYPDAHIRKTVHHYYCEESRGVMRLLAKMRGQAVDK